jgi:hypothetical protein
MGARLQTTPQALWLFQPTPPQTVASGRPVFESGIALKGTATGTDYNDFVAYTNNTDFFFVRNLAIARQANGEGGIFECITNRPDGDTGAPSAQITGYHSAHDSDPGATDDVVVGAITLHFKDGLFIGSD